MFIRESLLKLYQGFDGLRINDDMVDVQHTGVVTFYPVFTRNVICQEQENTLNCKLQYGSWMYDGFQVDVDFLHGVKNISLWDYQENLDYKLISQSGTREVSRTACCVYPHLTYWLKFERESGWW